MSFTYDYPRPAYTVDALVFDTTCQKVLLIRRAKYPYVGKWALPGGFMEMDETPEAAVYRELHEETSLKIDGLRQMHTFGTLDRDPRHRTISTVFFAREAMISNQPVKGGDDADAAKWFSLDALPELAFDHLHIIEYFKQHHL